MNNFRIQTFSSFMQILEKILVKRSLTSLFSLFLLSLLSLPCSDWRQGSTATRPAMPAAPLRAKPRTPTGHRPAAPRPPYPVAAATRPPCSLAPARRARPRSATSVEHPSPCRLPRPSLASPLPRPARSHLLREEALSPLPLTLVPRDKPELASSQKNAAASTIAIAAASPR